MASPLSDMLSLREEVVLRGLCRGLSNQEIADQLHLAIDTIKHAVTSLLRKLEARDRTQAVLIAFQHNLVDPPAPIPRWHHRSDRWIKAQNTTAQNKHAWTTPTGYQKSALVTPLPLC